MTIKERIDIPNLIFGGLLGVGISLYGINSDTKIAEVALISSQATGSPEERLEVVKNIRDLTTIKNEFLDKIEQSVRQEILLADHNQNRPHSSLGYMIQNEFSSSHQG